MDGTDVRAPAHPMVDALTSVVDHVVALVESSAEVEPRLEGQSAVAVLLALRAQLDRLVVASARLSVRVDEDGWWAVEGARSFPHWLAGASGMPFHRAREVLSTGRALRDHLPATARAALAGEVGAD